MEADNLEILDSCLSETELSEEELNEWLDITGESYKAYIEYVDEDYLCVSMKGDRYIAWAFHNYTWSDYYVFDRHTGRRLSLEDFVNNSPEEIKEMVKVYIVADVPYSDGEQSEDALEQDRFFVATEGLGIHYDVYEIGSYGTGYQNLIIPFEMFDMKEGMQPGERS